MAKGLDVSKYQGRIDFDLLKKEGVEFVLIRASVGAPDPGETVDEYQDPFFARNRSEAHRVGIRAGFYHYAYPQLNGAAAEANQFIATIGHLTQGEFLALDLEETHNLPQGWCRDWLDRVERALGATPLFYSYLSILRSFDWSSVSAKNKLWISAPSWTPEAARTLVSWPAGVAIWQGGIANFVHADIDESYIDLSEVSYSQNILASASTVPPHETCTVTGPYGVYLRRSPWVRTDNYSVRDGKPDMIRTGGLCDYDTVVHGQNVGGNDLWLHKPDGLYCWSGATNYQPKSI